MHLNQRLFRIPASITALAACAAITFPTSQAHAQASFFETFDSAGAVGGGQLGPSGLISAGWTFRRQANPQGTGTWNAYGNGWAYEGAACLAINTTITTIGGTGTAWAILPSVSNQHAGDPVTFWTSQGSQTAGSPTGRLQLRYSPSGGTNTGSNATDFGDFTQVLVDLPGLPNGAPATRRLRRGTALPGGVGTAPTALKTSLKRTVVL